MQLGIAHYWKSASSSLHLQFRKNSKLNQPKNPKPASPPKTKTTKEISNNKKYHHCLRLHPTKQNFLRIFYSYKQIFFPILEISFYGLGVIQNQESNRSDELCAFTEDK